MIDLQGTVIRVLGRHYIVRAGDIDYDCFLRGNLRRSKCWEGMTNPAAVGDTVRITPGEGIRASIEEVLPRRNHFSRKEKGRLSRADIIAANIDQVLMIQSFADPFLNLRFADRLAVMASASGIEPVLCVNKLDLSNPEIRDYVNDYYHGSGLTVLTTNCCDRTGIDRLAENLAGKRTLFVGISGSGKSTLINALNPGLELSVCEVSESTGKGRHTTTNVTMYAIDESTEIIDSPGMREFGIPDIEPMELWKHFYEFPAYRGRCAFSPCSHDHEPGCAVIEAVDNGEIDSARYQSYLNILDSQRTAWENRYR